MPLLGQELEGVAPITLKPGLFLIFIDRIGAGARLGSSAPNIYFHIQILFEGVKFTIYFLSYTSMNLTLHASIHLNSRL